MCNPFFYSSYQKLFSGSFDGSFSGNFSSFYHYGVGYNAFFYYFNNFFFGSNAGFGLVAFATYESESGQSAQKDDLFHDNLFL